MILCFAVTAFTIFFFNTAVQVSLNQLLLFCIQVYNYILHLPLVHAMDTICFSPTTNGLYKNKQSIVGFSF